jgi:transposase
MATVNGHLSVKELEDRYVRGGDITASRHFQVIWLSARGHTVSQVSATTAFGERWIEQLLARYNAEGPEALGDLRRRNGATATILKPELLARLRDRLREPPADGGLWSSRKAADWMASELGLTSVAPRRGWEALKAIGWPIQTPRPKNPKSASPEEAAAFKKTRGCTCRRGGETPWQANRSLRDRRAPHWPETRHPPRVGADRRTSNRAWPSPVRLALCHGVCLTGDR